MSLNIAIFASGSGTNAENIIRYFQENPFITIALVLSNKKEACVLEKAHNYLIPTEVFSKEELSDSNKVIDLLSQYHIDFIVLAGFLLRIPENILRIYPDRIINIHPSLLPKFGGKGMYGDRVHEAVVDAGEKETGITIHYLNEKYDEGNVIFQSSCVVSSEDTPQQVAAKVHELEYRYYPKVIEDVIMRQRLL